MHAYTVQDSRGLIKLDAMENPHRLSAELQQQLGQRLGALALNRYPDGRIDDLRAALKAHAQVPEGFDLMLGNGSDELISLLALACAVPQASILAPVPGFVMYKLSAQLQGLRFVGVSLTEDFALDEAAMLQAMAEHQPVIVYLAYPNNPTANLWDEAVMDRLIAAAPGLVVIDEAYQPFAGRSFIDRLQADPKLLLMRTMSKFGLAGVRIGYLIGRQALIAEMDKLRPPFNISVLNCEAALFALEHVAEYARQAEVIRSERAGMFAAFSELAAVKVWPSEANMLLVRVPDAQRMFIAMKQRGVLVKNVSAMHPQLAECLRITVGTPQENRLTMAAFNSALQEVLS